MARFPFTEKYIEIIKQKNTPIIIISTKITFFNLVQFPSFKPQFSQIMSLGSDVRSNFNSVSDSLNALMAASA